MSIRRLFTLFVALSVLLAPGLTAAVVAAPIGNHLEMMQSGHCNALPSNNGHHDKMEGKSCCISMCMGVAIAPVAEPFGHEVQFVRASFAVSTLHRPHLGEIATPPPRRA